jgi:hypothetical protein
MRGRPVSLAFSLLLAITVLRAASCLAAGAARDLSGIWEVRVTANVVEGGSFLCGAVPELNQTQVDTVIKASNLKELLYAVIPDSSRAWFDSVCDPVFTGDQVRATCRIPLTYARPCGLVSDVTFQGQLTGDTRFAGTGEADVTTGGPGLCPQATCPGQIRITARRIGGVPRAASARAP